MTELTNEMGVIGSVLLDPNTIDMPIDLRIKPQDFTEEYYRLIYESAVSVYQKGQPIDPITIKREAVTLDPSFDGTEINKVMIDAMDYIPTPKNMKVYCEALKNDSKQRELVKIVDSVEHNSLDADETIDELIEKLSNLQKGSTKRGKRTSVSLAEAGAEFISWMTSDTEPRMKLGYSGVDMLMGGMGPGDLVILAARPSVGKSAFSGNIMLETMKRGKKTLLFTAEMPVLQFFQRFVATKSGVALQNILSKNAKNGTQGAELADGVKEMQEMPGFIFDHPGITLHDIKRELQRINDVGLIVVDYLQLMKSTERSERRDLEVGKLTSGLKQLAMEFQIPIIVLSQLNRGKDELDEPALGDLRDSGNIEQDADSVLMLWKLERTEPGEIAKVGLKVAKCRSGVQGVRVMHFDGQYMRFTESAEEYVPVTHGFSRQFQPI